MRESVVVVCAGPGDPGEVVRALGAVSRGAVVAVRFEAGTPVAINGIEMPLVDLIASLDTIAGGYGVGRGGIRAGGSWRLYDAPAAVVLHQAQAALDAHVATADRPALPPALSAEYATLITSGDWFTPRRAALDAATNAV